jgi:hypothetical protein
VDAGERGRGRGRGGDERERERESEGGRGKGGGGEKRQREVLRLSAIHCGGGGGSVFAGAGVVLCFIGKSTLDGCHWPETGISEPEAALTRGRG